MANYKLLNKQLDSLISGINNSISVLSNTSALLFSELEDVSWVGFYLFEESHLVLGPFQGRVACYEIPVGKGVCGTAVKEDKTILVKNVHEFEGHIACDSRSNSEIVVPIHINNNFYGVLDIDSTSLNRFTEEDQKGLEEIVHTLERNLK